MEYRFSLALVCAAAMLCAAPVMALDIPPGKDICWKIIEEEEDTDLDIGQDAPIPGNFFGPESDPFDGLIKLRAGTEDRAIGIERLAPLDLSGPLPASDLIPIEIVHLDLVSIEPITVTINNGETPQPWDVHIELDPGGMQEGSMSVELDSPSGGTFNAFFQIPVLVVFTPAAADKDVAGNTIVLSGVNLATELGGPWFHDEEGLAECPEEATPGFVPGHDGESGQPVEFLNPFLIAPDAGWLEAANIRIVVYLCCPVFEPVPEGEGEGEGEPEGEGEGEVFPPDGEGEPDDFACPAKPNESAIVTKPGDPSGPAYPSNVDAGAQAYERIYPTSPGPAVQVIWWGVGTPPVCDLSSPPPYEITFFEDGGTGPGAVISQQTVIPTLTPTGETLNGSTIYRIDASLPIPVLLPNPSWISIYAPSTAECEFNWLRSDVGFNEALSFNAATGDWTALDDNLSVCIYECEERIEPGCDLLWPRPPSFWNFGVSPVPGGFFGTGSNPITSTVTLTASQSMVVNRLAQVPLCIQPPVSTAVQLTTLSLRSVNPITVSYSGVKEDAEELWDVQIDLAAPADGVLQVEGVDDGGPGSSGVFDWEPMDVDFTITFTPRDAAGKSALTLSRSDTLSASNVGWLLGAPGNVAGLATAACQSNFIITGGGSKATTSPFTLSGNSLTLSPSASTTEDTGETDPAQMPAPGVWAALWAVLALMLGYAAFRITERRRKAPGKA